MESKMKWIIFMGIILACAITNWLCGPDTDA